MVGAGSSFRVLVEKPGAEFVAGAVAVVGARGIRFVDVTADAFADSSEPGLAKLGWSFEVHPRRGGGSWLGLDLRATTTDEASWRELLPWWMSLGRAAHLFRRRFLSKLARQLEQPPPDAELDLPGDELVSGVHGEWTDAVTIEAPIETVWPALVQMRIKQAGWQPLRSTTEQLLLLGALGRRPSQPTTCAFVLEAIGDVATRLVARVRAIPALHRESDRAVPFRGPAPGPRELSKLWLLLRRVDAVALPNWTGALGAVSTPLGAQPAVDEIEEAHRLRDCSIPAEPVDEILDFGT